MRQRVPRLGPYLHSDQRTRITPSGSTAFHRLAKARGNHHLSTGPKVYPDLSRSPSWACISVVDFVRFAGVHVDDVIVAQGLGADGILGDA